MRGFQYNLQLQKQSREVDIRIIYSASSGAGNMNDRADDVTADDEEGKGSGGSGRGGAGCLKWGSARAARPSAILALEDITNMYDGKFSPASGKCLSKFNR